MDKKTLKDKGAAVAKAIKELEAAFDKADPKARVELNSYAKELSGKFKDAGKHFTVAARFKILKKRGRPSGSVKMAKNPAAKKMAVRKPIAKKPVADHPMAKKPAPSKPSMAASPDHPEIALQS